MLLLSRYSENHIIEKVSSYTFPLFVFERCFVERGTKGTYPFLSSRIGVSHLLVIASQLLEYPCIIRLFILLCVLNLIFYYKVKQLIGNATQECAQSQLILGWLGVWEELGRCLGLLFASNILRIHA